MQKMSKIKKDTCRFILSLDIGGANTKVSLLKLDLEEYIKKSEDNLISSYKNILSSSTHVYSDIQFFPFWDRKTEDFNHVLKEIKTEIEKIITDDNNNRLQPNYHVVVTVTAELSDAFYTKKEGIVTICDSLRKVFNESEVRFINVHGNFIKITDAIEDYLSVSASNWVSTSLVLGEREKLGILLDMGSTTLDLIPIKDGIPVTIGKNDVDRLLNYELFYTGILRPPVSTVAYNVPFRNSLCPMSFEEFALMADVYLILGEISEEQYTCDTVDGRGKDLQNCYARLSRIICGDPDMITREELDQIAHDLYIKQKELVKDAITRAIDKFIRRFIVPKSRLRFNITGLGAKILLEPALKELGIKEKQIFICELSEIEHIVSTAICLGVVYLKSLVDHFLYERDALIKKEQNDNVKEE
ncbi:MAG: hypothetical protein GF364_18040 [Candidatus Lokiarchaeota archaeon]|nr:hypothetical protein [Candidatus Lokiarchaeota archaeon]